MYSLNRRIYENLISVNLRSFKCVLDQDYLDALSWTISSTAIIVGVTTRYYDILCSDGVIRSVLRSRCYTNSNLDRFLREGETLSDENFYADSEEGKRIT